MYGAEIKIREMFHLLVESPTLQQLRLAEARSGELPGSPPWVVGTQALQALTSKRLQSEEEMDAS